MFSPTWLSILVLLGTPAKALARNVSTKTPTTTPSLVTYPIPSSIATINDYNVRVRSPGGAWNTLGTYLTTVEQVNTTKGSSIQYAASMAYFDFSGSVEVAVQYLSGPVADVEVRPLSYNIVPTLSANNTYMFSLTKPTNIVFQVNGDIFTPLHLLTNPIEENVPSADDPDVIYFGPGLHSATNGVQNVTSGQTLYLAGGAVLTSSIAVWEASNVTIRGRGVLYKPGPAPAVDVEYSNDVTIDGLISLNPKYGSYLVAQCENVTISNVRAFSATSWGDGIDLYSSKNVLVEKVFMRTSDDCIAIYNHRNDWYGNSTNITVRDSSLWADIAHPINVGTHGNPDDPETLSDVTISNLDILDHREPQMDYQGCIALNVGDANTIRGVLVEDVRVENFREGQLINMRIMYDTSYNTAPGRLISNVTIRNMDYNGNHSNPAIIVGYDDERIVELIQFENLTINGVHISDTMAKPSWYLTSDMVPMFVNEHVFNLTFT